MHYSPEHIETHIEEYNSKGGYSAAKLLESSEQLKHSDNSVITGGAPAPDSSLMDKIRDLHIPLGLISRRYPSKFNSKRNDLCDANCLDSNIFEELESMIFHKKRTDTRKNVNAITSSKTQRRRPTKHSKNT